MEPGEIILQENDDRAMTLVFTGSWKLAAEEKVTDLFFKNKSVTFSCFSWRK